MSGDIFHAVDYIATAAVLLISLAMGIYYAWPRKKQTTNEDYIVGGRQMSMLPVATSMAVTYLSAITILGFPAEVYYYGIIFAYYCIGRSLGFAFSALVYVPVLYPLKLSTGNQYIQMRYKSDGLVKFASILQIVSKIIMSGTYLYGPTILVQMVTGIPTWASLLVCGVVGTAYTTVGGFKAVIATDVFQAVIMLLGLIAVLVVGLIRTGGWSVVWEHYRDSGRAYVDFTPNPFAHNNIWAMALLPAIGDSWASGIMQAGVQRFSSQKTVERARGMLLIAIIPMVLMTTLATLMGVVAFGYYSHLGCDPYAEGRINNFNLVIPQLVADILRYPGLPGLFISASVCGALSNFSSTLNAIAGLCWEDLLSKKFQKLTESAKVRATKFLGIIFGCLSIATGFLVLNMTGTIITICIGLSAAGSIPIGIIFIIGIFFHRTNWKNALISSLVGFSFVCILVVGRVAVSYKHHTMPLPIYECNAASQDINGNYSTMGAQGNESTIYRDPGFYTNGKTSMNGFTFNETYTTVGSDWERTPLQTFLTISPYWYLILGLTLATITSVTLSFIPGFHEKGVDKNLVFTWDKIFIRTRAKKEDEESKTPMVSSESYKDSEKPPVLVMDKYNCDLANAEEKQHLNSINS